MGHRCHDKIGSRQPRVGCDAQSSLALYLAEINATPLLTLAEEKALAARVCQGDMEARDHMIRANLRLVVSIARGYHGTGLPLEDLIEEGNLGLTRAVELFDPYRKPYNRLSTYASYWIKQSIKRALVNTAKTIRIPSYMVEVLAKWRWTWNELRMTLGRVPESAEVANRLGLTAKERAAARRALAIQQATVDGPTNLIIPLEDLCPDCQTAGPLATMMAAEETGRALELLGRLEPRSAAILRLRMGLGGEEEMTLKQVGERLHLTRERVRQLEVEALRQLREWME